MRSLKHKKNVAGLEADYETCKQVRRSSSLNDWLLLKFRKATHRWWSEWSIVSDTFWLKKKKKKLLCQTWTWESIIVFELLLMSLCKYAHIKGVLVILVTMYDIALWLCIIPLRSNFSYTGPLGVIWDDALWFSISVIFISNLNQHVLSSLFY